MPQLTKVASVTDIPVGTSKQVDVDGKPIAIFNCDGTFYAVDNTCKHRGGPLSEGSVTANVVTCPWHGWEYDIRSGECKMDPSMTISTYEVKIDGDDILVSAR